MASRKVLTSKIKKDYPGLTKDERMLIVEKLVSLKDDGQSGKGKYDKVVKKVMVLNDKILPRSERSFSDDRRSRKMLGTGFFSKLASKAGDVALKGLHKVTNLRCDNPNKEWDYKPKAGEKHQVFKDGKCSYRARFSGPGTHVVADVKELIAKHGGNISDAVKKANFVSDVDREGMAHDIRYSLATSASDDKDEVAKLVRKADEKFISVLKRMPQDINTIVPLKAMQAKVLAENTKLVGVYSGDEKLSDEDVKLLEKVLAHLEMQGFGVVDSAKEFVGNFLVKGLKKYFSQRGKGLSDDEFEDLGKEMSSFIEQDGWVKDRDLRRDGSGDKKACDNCGRVVKDMKSHVKTKYCKNHKM